VVQPLPPPVMESFEVTFPSDWEIKNPDFGVSWVVTDTAASSGSQSMFMDNWAYNAQGSADEVVSNIIDLTSYASGEMTFDYAYQRATFQFDTFSVYVSGDCGQTWTKEWSRSGDDLATVAGVAIASGYVPTGPGDWATDTIDLSAYLNSSGVKIRFENIGWEGNYLFLDNINISALVNSGEAVPGPGWSMEVAPNPFRDGFRVSYDLAEKAEVGFELLDVAGRVLYRVNLPAQVPGQHSWELPERFHSTLPAGIYFLRGQAGTRQQTAKVVRLAP